MMGSRHQQCCANNNDDEAVQEAKDRDHDSSFPRVLLLNSVGRKCFTSREENQEEKQTFTSDN